MWARVCAGKQAKQARKRKRDDDVDGAQKAPQAFGKVVAYCTARACRRAMVLQHFGERLPAGTCSGCDHCRDPGAVERKACPLAQATPSTLA